MARTLGGGDKRLCLDVFLGASSTGSICELLDDDEFLEFSYFITKPNGTRSIRFEGNDTFRRRWGSRPLDHETPRALVKQGYKFGVVQKRKCFPASMSKASKPRGEGDTITRKSSLDNVSAAFKPY